MKGVLCQRELLASSLVSIYASSTLLSSMVLLLNFPVPAWAAIYAQKKGEASALKRENADQLLIAQNPISPPAPNFGGVQAQISPPAPNFGGVQAPILPPAPNFGGVQAPISPPAPNFGGVQAPTAPITIPVVPFELQNTPQRFQVSPQFNPYRLGPGDGISVFVQRFPDLTFSTSISPEGTIVVPLLGVVPVAGLTLEEVQEKIRLGLNRYVIDPSVAVALAGQRPVQVTITGAITRPGFYNLGFPSRLSTALLTAGGSTGQADLRQVRVRRFLLDGSFIEQRIDLFTPLAAGDPLPDLRLEDGDAIVVPQLEVGNDTTYDRQLVARSTIAKQTITIRLLSYPNQRIGNITLPNGSNFLDAFTAASPNLSNTDLTRIALIRFDPERGRAIVRELNGKRALFGDASQNVPLRDNDVIVIGRNLVGRITYALNTFTQPFRDILGFLLFFQSLTNSANDLFSPSSGNNNNN